MLHYDVLTGKYAKKHLEQAKKMLGRRMPENKSGGEPSIQGLNNVGLAESLGQNQALNSNYTDRKRINQDENRLEQKNMADALRHDTFDSASATASDMVLNLFIFDENGNEIGDLPINADAPTYSTDNPFAQYASDDPDAKQSADDWENRKPLTQERLAAMNAMAQSMGYAVYIEDYHASLGVFQAAKADGNRHVEIDGKFINNDGSSAQDASTDFTVTLHEDGEIEEYIYTNDLAKALERGNGWLAGHNLTELAQILADLQAGASPMGLDFAHIATLVDDDRDTANQIRAYLDTHWLIEVA